MTAGITSAPAQRTGVRKHPNRLKSQFHLWLDPATDAALRAAAEATRTPTTILAERFIREGLGLLAAERLEGPALPAVRQLVEEITGQQADRLAGLIVKAFVEASMARRLTYPVVHKLHGPETASQLFDAAKTRAFDDLKRKIGETQLLP